MFFGKSAHGAFPLAGGTVALAVLIGLGLRLDGAPRTRFAKAAVDGTSSNPGDGVAAANVRAISEGSGPRRSHADAETRVSIGRLPSSGYRVMNVVTVDWRDDRGTKARAAGKPQGSQGLPGSGNVASGCSPPFCSFDIECDDANPCTIDRCDIVPGSGLCTGTCAFDPVPNGKTSECDNGVFCDGRETCQGAHCTIFTAPNVLNQLCDTHASCGEDGTCDAGSHTCTGGNIGEHCNAHEDCDVAGRCAGGVNANDPCNSDAGCPLSTCIVKGHCQPGVCASGVPAICCSDPGNETICAEYFPRCSAGSSDAGAACQTNADCPGGTCERCQPSCTTDSDCNDGRRCNGTETCEHTCVGGPTPGIVCTIDANCAPGGVCLGQCQPGLNPCGAGANCVEKKCSATVPPIYCLLDSDCPAGETCNDVTPNPPGIVCFLGRCCSSATEPLCTKAKLADCDNTAGSQWYPGDDGELTASDQCGGENPLLHEEWGCPKYGSGLSQHDAANPPICPVTVGPVSDSPVCVPAPGGPGGSCPDPDGPAGRLYQLGDDYTVSNGSYIGLEVMRFVGGLLTDGAISIEFYDANGTFVEDVALIDTTNDDLGIQVVIFNPPLIIPPSGYVVIRAASDTSPNSRIVWLSTTLAGLTGTNDPDALWINSYPGPAGSVNNNYLKMCNGGPHANEACVTNADCPDAPAPACPGGDCTCVAAPGILAFELVGDKVPAPVGACCEQATGKCVDGVVSWVCGAQGNIYHGDGSICAACNGGPNFGLSCRKCVGAPQAGQACTGDAFCAPGTCEPDNASCPPFPGPNPNVCTTGTIGNPCSSNAQCNLAGLCDLFSLICAVGNVGQACTLDSQCDVAGTCVPVSCQPLAACAQGACCDPATGSCALTASPGACPGDWQGFGTDCDSNCCPVPNLSGLRCMGGPNNLQSCTVDTHCRFCVGGSHDGEACTTTSAPEPNGCLDEGHCIGQVCVGGSPPTPNTCTVDAECPDNSGQCRGRCVNRGTGGDNCEDALIQIITVPTLEEGPKTVTISGTNVWATSMVDEPDSCFGPTVLANDDPGWFEALSLDKCARMRIDFCCSDPIRQPAYTFLFPDCPCGQPIFSVPDPYVFGQPDAGQGPPYCDDDNAWATFPQLPAGTYYYPIYSALAGAHGDYQMHITVQACPTAACCYQVCGSVCVGGDNPGATCNGNEDCLNGGTCSGNGGPNFGNHCDKNATCPGGVCLPGSANAGNACDEHFDCGPLSDPLNVCSVTCLSQCEELVKNDCDALLGYFLGPPNIAPARPLCLGNPCETGSCCTGPALCLDQVSETDDTPMTSALCDEFNGNFIGGVRCAGGTCVGGPDSGETCSDYPAGQCAAPGICVGSAQELAQANPCPVCQIQGSGNCQAWDNSPQTSPSDPSSGSELVWADDFILTAGGTLDSVCLWGTYVETDPTTTTTDCGGPETPDDQRADNFRVRVYEDDGGKPGGGHCSNVPAIRCFQNFDCPTGGSCLLAPIGDSTCTRTKAVIPGAATEGTAWGGKTWSFQLSLTTPIEGLLAGKCYWLEVTNNTPDAVFGEKCTWHWSQLAEDSIQGNQFSAAGSETNGYGAGSQRAWDMAWCLNLSVAPGGCASQPRACCTCLGSCTTATLNDCDDANGVWHEDDLSCPPAAGCSPPPNDACDDAVEVPVGVYSVSTQCATTDGGNPVQGAIVDRMNNEVWYFFRPSEDCPLRADGCTSSQKSFDSAIAIYHDASDPTHCVCPLDRATGDRTLVDASNDDCVVPGSETGGVVEVDALAGHCYTIRFAGVPGNHPVGRSAVEISCGPPKCGDQRRNGAEQCDGLDNANCLTATPSTLCRADCTCGAPNPCGNGLVEPGEECDPGGGIPCPAPSLCRQAGDPRQCTCTAFCGNNNIEEGEECDGTDDAVCPGRCEADCTCPPLVCGNGRLEESAGEECEFGLCVPVTGLRRCSESPYAICADNAACAPGICLNVDECSVDMQCGAGTCDLAADRLDCPEGQCRTKNDPLGGCRCGCALPAPPCGNNIVDPESGEQCDGTATDGLCRPDQCRAPGDPSGGCTCACPPAGCCCDADVAAPFGGDIDALDIVYIVDCWKGFHSGPECDVNCDGVVTTRDIYDAICILHYPGAQGAQCCSSPHGACCVSTYPQCQELPNIEFCSGTYLGDGSTCDMGPCDCNSNNIPDRCDVDCGTAGGPCDVPGCGLRPDCNHNQYPDECETPDPATRGACCFVSSGGVPSCTYTNESNCNAVLGVWRQCVPCPAQNAMIVNEPGGQIFVHVIGPPVDCTLLPNSANRVAAVCPPGPRTDPWASPANAQMCHTFGVAGSPPIPAGFFPAPAGFPGAVSNAFSGSVCLKGAPLGHPDFPHADTLIKRLDEPFLRCAVPSPLQSTVEIEVDELSLVSVTPIMVTYTGPGSPPSELWNVAVDASPTLPPRGTLTAIKSRCDGGTFTSTLYVQPRFTFTNVNHSPVALDTGLEDIDPVVLVQTNPQPWSVDVDPNLPVESDPCSDFHPGIVSIHAGGQCDCNDNGIQDRCDIEAGTAKDCNLNSVPDACDIANGRSLDVNPQNGVPDECGPPVIVWNADLFSADRTTRSLKFTAEPPASAPGSPGLSAIKVTMIDLQNPIPPNLPQNPAQNFSGYESATCAPFKCVGGSRNGLTCMAVGDCPKACVGGTNAGTLCPNGNECTGAGASCPATTCTAAVEANGCARWVGKPGTFLESQDGGPASGTYRAARLQCTPFYWHWVTETRSGPITVVGAEIAPSSEYSVQAYGASCAGSETGCTAVSSPVTMYTRRSGDVGPNFNPPATTTQPDAIDVVALVNKFKGLAGAPVKAIAQIQPNLTELNADLSALDITAAVDGVKGVAYSFSGPCACPSTVPCGITACANATVCVDTYGVGSTCVKTCVGGTNAGDPCINTTNPHNHCPGGGTCGAGGATPGFCRDRCGRCSP